MMRPITAALPSVNLPTAPLLIGLLPALLIGAAPAEGQFSLSGGPILADLFGSDVQSADTRTGLTGGGAYTLFRLGPAAISAELFYAQKGAAESRLGAESPEFFNELGLDYVEIPILARVGFSVPGTGDALHASLSGGPAFAWRLNCNIRLREDGTGSLSEDCLLADASDARTVVASADQGLVLGGALELDTFGLGSVLLGVRMVRGLVRVSSGADGVDAKNRALSATLGFSFAPEGF